jgi:hypothetical protein
VPSNPSTTPVETRVVRPTAERALVVTADKAPPIGRRAAEASAHYFLTPPFERNTVLRN